MQAYKKRNLKLTRSFRHSAFASDSKIIKFGQGNLNFAKFKLQIIKFLTKFAHQIKTEVIKMFTKSIYQSDILLAKFSLAHRQI